MQKETNSNSQSYIQTQESYPTANTNPRILYTRYSCDWNTANLGVYTPHYNTTSSTQVKNSLENAHHK